MASKQSTPLAAAISGTGAAPGGGVKVLMRAVSFLGLDWVGSANRGSDAAGRGVIFGGTRRIGAAGVRVGRTILTAG